MENIKISKNLIELENIRKNFENGNITLDDISIDDARLLNLIYDLEILETEENINQIDEKLESYKSRMRAAIEYLKNKKKYL